MSTATKAAPANGAITKELDAEWKPTVDWNLVKVAKRVGMAQEGYRGLMEKAANAAEKSVYLAQGIGEIKEMLRQQEVLRLIKSLMNSPLGFMCDKPNKKDPGVYADEDIISAVTEALMRGLRFTGNEFNIIAARCYPAQAGLMRLVKEFPGLTDLELMPGAPRDSEGQRVVRFAARWKLNGKEMCLRDPNGQPGVVIPVIANDFSSADQLIGKATRKALHRIYTMISGSEIPEGEVEETPAPKQEPPGPGKQSLKPAQQPAAKESKPSEEARMLTEFEVQDLFNDLHQATNPLELRAAIEAITRSREQIGDTDFKRLNAKITEMAKIIK